MTEKVSIINKLIAGISPVRALKREIARQRLEALNTGYSHHGASTRRKYLSGWNSRSGSPKEDINDNLHLLRERSRDLYMGGANIATGALRTLRTNSVGSGLVLKPSIDYEFLKMTDKEAEDWRKTVLREFEYFAGSVNCDRFRLNNFYELQQLAFLSVLLSGDVFALLPFKKRKGFIYDLRVQLIEADRVATPMDRLYGSDISQGVEVSDGEVKAYHIFNKHPGSSGFDYSSKRVEAFGTLTGRRNMLHLMESERPDQTRGVPVLASVIESLKQLGEYTKAELSAAVAGGLFAVLVKTEYPQGEPGERTVAESIDEELERDLSIGYGTVGYLGPNEDIKMVNPSRPNAAFDGFVIAVTKQIGAALEIPYELVIKHFTASYSASRAALLEAWKMFRLRRVWFANDFCQPIYEEWLAEAVAKGRIYAPGFFDDPVIRAAYSKAEWHGPSQGQIDPLKEIKAAVLRIESGLSTGEREAAELTGTDFDSNHRQLIKEAHMRNTIKEILNELTTEKIMKEADIIEPEEE